MGFLKLFKFSVGFGFLRFSDHREFPGIWVFLSLGISIPGILIPGICATSPEFGIFYIRDIQEIFHRFFFRGMENPEKKPTLLLDNIMNIEKCFTDFFEFSRNVHQFENIYI